MLNFAKNFVKGLKETSPYSRRLTKAAELAEAGQFDEASKLLERANRTAFSDDLKAGLLFLHGVILTDWARHVREAEESINLLECACQNFEDLAQIESVMNAQNQYSFLYEWANTLAEYGRKCPFSQKEQLYNRANERYAEAEKIIADQSELYNSWGNLLTDIAIIKKGSTAQSLLIEACSKFNRGIELDEKSVFLYSNLGRALFHQASLSKQKEVYLRAKEQFQEALRYNPDMQSANAGMGAVCAELVELSQGSDLENYYEFARKHLEKAVELKSEDDESFFNIANLCWKHSKRQGDIQKSNKMLEEAVSYAARAVEINQNNSGAYLVLGCIFLDQSFLTKGGNKRKLLVEAGLRFQKAIALNPCLVAAHVNQGTVLLNLAKVCGTSSQKDMLEKSCDSYRRAIEIDPDVTGVYNNFIIALFRYSKLTEGSEKNRALDEIISIYQKISSVRAGSWAYNIACAYALKSDKDNCKKWLLAGQECDALEIRQHAMNDSDLKIVRDEPWFNEICWRGEVN